MNKENFFGLRSKMIMLFGILFLLGSVSMEWARLYGIPFVGFEGIQHVLKKNTLDNFSVIADLQKDNISAWLMERKYDVKAIAGSPAWSGKLQELGRLLEAYKKQGKSGEELWQALREEPSYKEARSFLHQVQRVYGDVFHRFVVVDNSTGFVVLAMLDEDNGKKVFDSRLKPVDLTEDGVFVTIRRCDLIGGAGDFLLAAPVMGEGSGNDDQAKESDLFLVTYVNLGSFLSPMLKAAKGLGQNGEVVLVNQEQRILTPLKFPVEGGTRAVPLEYKINAEPARRAASGEEGVLEGRDYRGVKVLAAYRNVPISRKESIGMVVKENFDDVFWPVRENLLYSLGVTCLGMLLGMIVIYLLSSSFVSPIKRMAEVARRAQAGDLSARISEFSNDEIGFLGRQFNVMLERVSGWKEELERTVQSRTAELMAANQQLQASEQQLQAANQQLRASQQQLTAINQQLVANEQQLRQEVELRTKTENETKKHLHELEIFFKASIGREERILELKKKVEEMERKFQREQKKDH